MRGSANSKEGVVEGAGGARGLELGRPWWAEGVGGP